MAYDPVTGERTGGPEPMPKKKGREERLETFREVHTEQEIRTLIQHLKDTLKDESSADAMYLKLAGEADDVGFPVVAATFRSIASDERRHHGLVDSAVRALTKSLETSLAESERGRY